jgi:tRNA-splicing ligase RtcB (3'-phosphate/5'-hydroxy nucleic acid ligase)
MNRSGKTCGARRRSRPTRPAGRVMSRSEAEEKILTRDPQSRMRRIVYRRPWSARFRDEAPQAYRELHEVMQAQRQLVRTTAVLSPILNDKRP